MYLSRWVKKWIYAVSISLVLVMGCSAYMLWSWSQDKPRMNENEVMKQVRLMVNGIMLYLEQYHQTLPSDPTVSDALQKMSETSGVNLLFSRLDGKVIFDSSPEKSLETIDVRTSLHYDFYTPKTDDEFYEVTFPVISQETEAQVGNAIFIVPAALFGDEPSHPIPLLLSILIIFCLLIVFILLWFLRRKINHDTIRPIQKLKYYSEVILRGDYEHKADYTRMDEIGELYAMFDQMRLEIMHLSKRREEQDKAQKELISNLSHDLKTPLTTVKAYLEAIRAGICPDMESVLEYVQVMQTNTHKMTVLLDDLLLHALKELGQISVHPTEQYSRDVLEPMIKPIGHFVRTAGITFIEPAEIPNVLIHVDANRLEQVISNLIANALKHTSPGGTIRIDIEQELDQLTFTITDTGKGIRPQDMPFIFERYFKGQMNSYSGAAQNEGWGLGLSICKYIIEAHKGAISFRSAPDQGTVFYFSIPLC